MRNPPIAFVKTQLFMSIANRSTSLVNQLTRNEITEKHYDVMQFPADFATFINKAIDQACIDFNYDDGLTEELMSDARMFMNENPDDYMGTEDVS